MDENKIVNVKALLYDADTDEVKRIISQTEDQEILYVYAYNYNCIGDGKIFVYNVAKVVKVRTGEQDYAALQDVE